jgi:glycosyltransferase involved in cell wall biosynthesis
MRIGIDATCWANERGYGRYTRELVGAMLPLAPAHEFVCFLDERSAACFDQDAANVRPVVVNQAVSPTLAASAGGRRSPLDMFRLTTAVRRENVDVFFSPSVYGFFPLPPGLPAVVVIHDAIPERFPDLTLPSLRDRVFWWMKVRLALSQTRLVLTVSDHAAQEIATHLGIPQARMRVTLEGVSAAYRPSESEASIREVAARVGVPEGARWLIAVGGFNPHKRIDLLVRAHAELARRHTAQPLVLLLVGPKDDGFHSDIAGIRETIRECGTEDLVRWPGYLSDDDLRHLHSGAVALVLASEAEGFGLPAVEAARCGAPVVATTSSPLPDVLEGGGLFVQPGDLQALESALDQMLTDEEGRRAMGRRALERARALSWPRSAQVALDALEAAAASRLRAAV